MRLCLGTCKVIVGILSLEVRFQGHHRLHTPALSTFHGDRYLNKYSTAGLSAHHQLQPVQSAAIQIQLQDSQRVFQKGLISDAVQIWDYFLPAWNNIISSNSEAGTGVCYSGTTREVYPPNRGGAGWHLCALIQACQSLQKSSEFL